MSIWKYTKKLIMDNKSTEGAHDLFFAFGNVNGLQDWWFEQVEAGLADNSLEFCPFRFIPDFVFEVLVTDQVQADSFMARSLAVAENIGHPLSGIIVDVDFTSETIPDDFRVPDNSMYSSKITLPPWEDFS